MKTLLRLGIILFGLISANALCAGASVDQKTTPTVTLEEIAGLKSIRRVEQLAKDKNIPYDIQTNEAMRAQAVPEYTQSVSFTAIGRLRMTFWLKSENDTVTVIVSFFYDDGGHILGRAILIENNNVP